MEEKTVLLYIILGTCLISIAEPKPQNDIFDPSFDDLSKQSIDYNAVMSHLKDFFMYLPIMFTTIKDTMYSFPKLAEGIRILTAANFEKSSSDDDDCNCKAKSLQSINDLGKTSDYS